MDEMTGNLRVTAVEGEPHPTFKLEGDFDCFGTPAFKRVVRQPIEEKPLLNRSTTVVLDFTGVTYLAAEGLGAMIRLRRLLGEVGAASVTIRGASPEVKQVLRITNVDKILDVE